MGQNPNRHWMETWPQSRNGSEETETGPKTKVLGGAAVQAPSVGWAFGSPRHGQESGKSLC